MISESKINKLMEQNKALNKRLYQLIHNQKYYIRHRMKNQRLLKRRAAEYYRVVAMGKKINVLFGHGHPQKFVQSFRRNGEQLTYVKLGGNEFRRLRGILKMKFNKIPRPQTGKYFVQLTQPQRHKLNTLLNR